MKKVKGRYNNDLRETRLEEERRTKSTTEKKRQSSCDDVAKSILYSKLQDIPQRLYKKQEQHRRGTGPQFRLQIHLKTRNTMSPWVLRWQRLCDLAAVASESPVHWQRRAV
jgi:hypothetical protein